MTRGTPCRAALHLSTKRCAMAALQRHEGVGMRRFGITAPGSVGAFLVLPWFLLGTMAAHAAGPAPAPAQLIDEAVRVVRGAAPQRVTLPDYLPGADASDGSIFEATYIVRAETGAAREPMAVYLPGVLTSVRVKVNGHIVSDHVTERIPRGHRGADRLLLSSVPAEFVQPGVNEIEITVASLRWTSLSKVWFGSERELRRMYDRKTMLDGRRADRGIGRDHGAVAVHARPLGEAAPRSAVRLLRVRRAAVGPPHRVDLAARPAAAASPLQHLVDDGLLVLLCAAHHLLRPPLEMAPAPLREGPLGRAWHSALSCSMPATSPASRARPKCIGGSLWIGAVAVGVLAVGRYAFEERNTRAVLLLAAGGIAFAFGVRDWLVARSDSDNNPVYLTSYSGLVFFPLVAWILIDNFVTTARALSQLNVELERRVVDKSAELQRALDDMRQAKDAAEAADRAKSSFLAVASHDLRQPAHALGLYVAALRTEDLTAEQYQLTQRMSDSVIALDTMFNALLDISRMEAGAVVPEVRSLDLESMLHRVASDFSAEAAGKRLRFSTRVSKAARNLRARSDPMLLERIIRNLLGNAVRYTQTGGVLLACRLRDDQWRVEIRDTGPGIRTDLHKRIFEEFFQIDGPEREQAGGLGLGLSIVRRLSELLGHPLTLRSIVGRRLLLRANRAGDPRSGTPFRARSTRSGRCRVWASASSTTTRRYATRWRSCSDAGAARCWSRKAQRN